MLSLSPPHPGLTNVPCLRWRESLICTDEMDVWMCVNVLRSPIFSLQFIILRTIEPLQCMKNTEPCKVYHYTGMSLVQPSIISAYSFVVFMLSLQLHMDFLETCQQHFQLHREDCKNVTNSRPRKKRLVKIFSFKHISSLYSTSVLSLRKALMSFLSTNLFFGNAEGFVKLREL